MHPRYEVAREYAVRVAGELDDWSRERLLTGVDLDGEMCKFEAIEDRGGEAVNRWHHVLIREGKNREVRRLFEGVGLTVSRLIRVRFGAIALPPQLKRGMMRELDASEVTQLMNIHRMDEPGLQGSTRRLPEPVDASMQGDASFDVDGSVEIAPPVAFDAAAQMPSDEMSDGFALDTASDERVNEAPLDEAIDSDAANALINSERAFSPADDGDLDASPEELPQAFTARTPRGQRIRHEKKRRDAEPRAADDQFSQQDSFNPSSDQATLGDGQSAPVFDAAEGDGTAVSDGERGSRVPRGRRNNSSGRSERNDRNDRNERNRGPRPRRDARPPRAAGELSGDQSADGKFANTDASQSDGTPLQVGAEGNAQGNERANERGSARPAPRGRKPRNADSPPRRKPREGAATTSDAGARKPRSGKGRNKANFADDNVGNRIGGKKGKSLLGVDARGAGKGKPGRKKKGEKEGEVSIAKLFSRGKDLVIPAAPEEVKPKKRSLANVKAYIEGDGNAVGTIRLRKRDTEE
jgi:hypothetical protein